MSTSKKTRSGSATSHTSYTSYTSYTVELELDQAPPTGHELDELLEHLTDYHPSIRRGHGTTTQILLTIPATTIRQATTTAIALTTAPTTAASGTPPAGTWLAGAIENGASITKITAQSTERFTREQHWPAVPDLLSVTEAADTLGVSRQRILQMIGEGKLPRHTIGTTNAIPRTALPLVEPTHQVN